jgi:hypothetical protein
MTMQVRERREFFLDHLYMVQVVVYKDDLPASQRKHPIEAGQLSPVTLRLLVLPRSPRSGKCIQRSHCRTIGGESKGNDAKVIILSWRWHRVG